MLCSRSQILPPSLMDKPYLYKLIHSEIIYYHWTFNFVCFVGRAIHEFQIPTKYWFTLVILIMILDPRIQVPSAMSIIIKPRNLVPMNLNDCTIPHLFSPTRVPGARWRHHPRHDNRSSRRQCPSSAHHESSGVAVALKRLNYTNIVYRGGAETIKLH